MMENDERFLLLNCGVEVFYWKFVVIIVGDFFFR